MVTGTHIFLGLFNNLAIFIVMVAAYSFVICRFKNIHNYQQQTILGFFFGVFAVGCMYARIPVAEGVIVDQRNAIVALSGAFGGPLSALLSAVIASSNRFFLGGAGVFAGVVGIFLSATAGICLYSLLGPKESLWKGVTGALAATLFTLPGFLFYEDLPTGWALLKSVGVPYSTAIFLGMFLGGLLLVREERRHRAEMAQKLATERLRDFAESASDWLWELDQELRFSFVSDRFEKVIKHPISEVLGKQRWDIAHIDLDPDFWSDHKADLLARRPFKNLEYPLKLNSGETVYCNVSGVPVFDDNGKFVGYRGSSSDISERKQMEQKLLHKDQIKSEFIATASHELRTPLASVLGYAELMLDHDHFGPKEQREYLSHIRDKALILERIVSELLDISRIESGRIIPLVLAPVNVFAVVQQILEQFRKEKHHCRFTAVFSDEQLEVPADRGKLIQVFENLIGNAVKFTPQGGEIHISGEVVDGDYQVMIADEGIGMSAEQQKFVFEKFYRVDGSDTAIPGLGIGLHLTKNILTAHQGKIWIESKAGEGSRFYFTLPL